VQEREDSVLGGNASETYHGNSHSWIIIKTP
jgi:hypothetical protein